MTFNPFRRRTKELDVKKFWDKATIIPSAEGAWTRSPYGPRTLEENRRLMQESRRLWAKIDEG
jgi:hypothetical protein